MTSGACGRLGRRAAAAARTAAAGVLAVALVVPAAVGGASGADDADAASALAVPLTFTLTGVSYLHPGRPRARADARLLLEPVWAVAPWGELTGAVVLAADSDREIARRAAPDWLEGSLRGRAVEVRELALAVHLAAADLTLGKQVVAWGVGDALQPTDSMTPRDLTDPLLDHRLGAWGASADLFLGGFEAVLTVLRHAPERLPLLDRRWSPVGDIGPLGVVRRLPGGGDAWIAGIQLRGYTRSLDWSLVARRGPDLAPHLAGLTPAALRLSYPTMTLLGGWVSVPAGGLVVRAEAAWRRYDRHAGLPVAEDFATALVGAEHRFPGLVGSHDATLVVELAGERHTGGLRLPREVAVLDPVRLFRSGLFAKLLVHNPTGWEAEVGGGAELDGGGGLLQLLVRDNLDDHLAVELGLDLLAGGDDPALQALAGNDRLVVRTIVRP